MRLYVCIGISGSGKSTWAAKCSTQCRVVSTDKIREFMFGDESVQSHPEDVFDEAYREIFKYLLEGKNVIFDATNLRRVYRRKLFEMFGGMAELIAVDFGCDCARAIENQYKRDRHVPEQVVRAQSKRYEKPMYDEGWVLSLIHI